MTKGKNLDMLQTGSNSKAKKLVTKENKKMRKLLFFWRDEYIRTLEARTVFRKTNKRILESFSLPRVVKYLNDTLDAKCFNYHKFEIENPLTTGCHKNNSGPIATNEES